MITTVTIATSLLKGWYLCFHQQEMFPVSLLVVTLTLQSINRNKK